jgi:hypothetical protein
MADDGGDDSEGYCLQIVLYKVPVRIGWDTNSPSPLIGVQLALTVERVGCSRSLV